MQCCGAIYHLVDPKIDKSRQNPQDTCSKIPGRVFSEVAEAPQAATTSRTARGGGGTLKPVKLVQLLVRTNFGDEIDIFFKYSYAHFPCSHSSFACTGTHYVCWLEKLHVFQKIDFSKSQNWNLGMSMGAFSACQQIQIVQKIKYWGKLKNQENHVFL